MEKMFDIVTLDTATLETANLEFQAVNTDHVILVSTEGRDELSEEGLRSEMKDLEGEGKFIFLPFLRVERIALGPEADGKSFHFVYIIPGDEEKAYRMDTALSAEEVRNVHFIRVSDKYAQSIEEIVQGVRTIAPPEFWYSVAVDGIQIALQEAVDGEVQPEAQG